MPRFWRGSPFWGAIYGTVRNASAGMMLRALLLSALLCAHASAAVARWHGRDAQRHGGANADDVASCPVGQYASPATRHCTRCPPGKYSPPRTVLLPAAACEWCKLGQWQSRWGAPRCFPCPVGETTAHPGASARTVCRFKPCPRGKFRSAGWGAWSVCLGCPAGRALDPRTKHCTKRTRHAAQVKQQQQQQQQQLRRRKRQPGGARKRRHRVGGCAPGWAPLQRVRQAEARLPPGEALRQAELRCTRCPAGRMQVERLAVARGVSVSGEDQQQRRQEQRSVVDTCEPCPAGRYQPAAGRTECLDCAQGRFERRTASTACGACDACPAGQLRDGCWGEQIGECIRCGQDCALGSYSVPCSSRRGAACLPCPAGKYKPNRGAEPCTVCAAASPAAAAADPGPPAQAGRTACGSPEPLAPQATAAVAAPLPPPPPHQGRLPPTAVQLGAAGSSRDDAALRRRYANGGAGVLAMTIGVWAYCVERRRHAARFVAVAAGGGLQGAGAAAPAAHQSASVRMDEHGNWVSTVTTDDGQSFVIR